MKKSSKKTIKILVVLMIILSVICMCNAVFAAPDDFTVDPVSPVDVPFAGRVISIVQYICYAAAVIWIMILGVRYMTSSPDGKAEMKKQAFAALIGGVVLFGVGTIIKMVYEIVSKLN